MITILTTIFDRAGKHPIGQIARQGCSWVGFRPGQIEPFFYGSSRQDVIEAIRAEWDQLAGRSHHAGR